MILITKKPEPRYLTEYKKQPFASYNGCDKGPIRLSLFEEQGHLCAYCMRRIQDASHMTIEHYRPQHPQGGAANTRDSLDYNNMLGVCLGNQGNRKERLTCDKHRNNLPLTVNPYSQSSIDKIAYRLDGTIYSADPAINKDLSETLNLNDELGHLKPSRQQALGALLHYLLSKYPQGQWPRGLLTKAKAEFSKVSSDGSKREYLGILLFFLEKFLRKCQ